MRNKSEKAQMLPQDKRCLTMINGNQIINIWAIKHLGGKIIIQKKSKDQDKDSKDHTVITTTKLQRGRMRDQWRKRVYLITLLNFIKSW